MDERKIVVTLVLTPPSTRIDLTQATQLVEQRINDPRGYDSEEPWYVSQTKAEVVSVRYKEEPHG